MTVGSYENIFGQLLPKDSLRAKQTAQMLVSNFGNETEKFQIEWQSLQRDLAFELLQGVGEDETFTEVKNHTLEVEPGKQEKVLFRTGLKKRPWFGRVEELPFQVKVHVSAEQEKIHPSKVRDGGRFSIWWVPIFLFLCVFLSGLGIYFYPRPEPPPLDVDGSWTRVQQSGWLRVATAADYAPFVYFNDRSVIDGFDAFLIRDIGAYLGVPCAFDHYAFEELDEILADGRADVAIAALSLTEAREENFDFSNIYYVEYEGILARESSKIEKITETKQMAGSRIGVQQFTVYEEWVRNVLIAEGTITEDQLRVFADPNAAVEALRKKEVDLVLMDLHPASTWADKEDFKLVGQGLHPQYFAIALPKGADSLKGKINEALLHLQEQGHIEVLVTRHLGIPPTAIIPPPTLVPTQVPCVDDMVFIEDLNYDDQNSTKLPIVRPGENIQKGWRIQNNGTCTWNNNYSLRFIRGDQMDGHPKAIEGQVLPGENYDIYIDLVAPNQAGSYKGFWQLHNADQQDFGDDIWVAVQVVPDTPTPTSIIPTATPEPTAQATATMTPTPTATIVPGSDLWDKTWKLEGYLADLADKELTKPIKDSNLDLNFFDNYRFDGFAGCNNFSGKYDTNGSEISFKDILANQMMCDRPEGIMQQEAIYLKLLADAEVYQINKDGKLEILRYVIENDQRIKKVILLFED